MTDSTNNRRKVFSGFFWSYAERMMAQIISLVVSLVLARMLGPEAYGVLAVVNIFIGIANAVALTGFGSALVQKLDADNLDFSSALYFSVGVSIFAYLILYVLAPYFEVFLSVDEVTPVLRVLSVSLVIASVNTVQHAYLIRKMEFKKLFFASLCGSIVSAGIGITLAYYNYGVWALVCQYLSNSIVDVLVLVVLSDWRPELSFSINRIKQIYGFGWKVVAVSVIDKIYMQSRSIAIGKKYQATDLAFYDRGLQFPSIVITNINTTIANVLMPAMSSVQTDLVRVKELVRRSIKTSSTLVFPLLIGLAICSPSIILIILTDKWSDAIPYAQILCIALMMKPMQTANLQGFLAIGKSGVFLIIQLLQKIIGILVIIISIVFFNTPLAVAYGEVISYLLFLTINIIPNKMILDYSLKEQFGDILPQLCISIVMGVIVLLLPVTHTAMWLDLIARIFVGGLVYIVVSRIFKIEGFMYLWSLLIKKGAA